MSSNPAWWPYRLPIEEALKKSVVLVVGVVVGANVVEYFWKPMQNYDTELDKGKLALLQKYKKIHDERTASGQNYVLSSSDSSLVKITTTSLDNFNQEDFDFCRKYGFRNPDEWIVSTFDDRPGLYVIPGALRKEHTAEWVKRTIDYSLPPHTTNLTIHGTSPTEEPLKEAGKSLRWTTLGVEYNWVTKEYPPEGDALPEELVKLAEVVCRCLDLGDMSADATIVNYYPPKSTLSPHVDRSERSTKPLVSLSLGQTAVYLTGGKTLEEEPIPIWLRSGDILVMHGEQRFVYHAVPCVAPISQREKFNAPDDILLEEYLNTSRVNVTIRQVNV